MHTILVAEDDDGVREMVTLYLTDLGYKVESAFGASALASALARPPDLILLDLMMPDLDGLALRDELRKHPRTRDIPIIIMTAFRHPERWFNALVPAGYLVKPFQLEVLEAMVKQMLA